jgi:uncharacterized protein (TIGR02680 family)
VTISQLTGRSAAPGEATQPRWRPTRAGILNVWRYYDEVFEFHRGRLLLRGPNGTGKSKALEVLMPFLFDANLRANRLSTFGTSDRTMHWNLMGAGATGVTRVGYVWMEFALDGVQPRWFTCGARLQASVHTTTVHPDFFTTELRVGRELSLVNDAQQPLTTSALTAAIGAAGTVHPTADAYRAAVRSALFPELDGQRYDALITALLQLRTPKLSERLDPGLLSCLLSKALPPLDQAEIAELAEGFERLDRRREEVRRLEDEVTAAESVAGRARTYAQRVLRAGAASLISATTKLDNLTRAARESEVRYEAAVADRAGAENDRDGLDDRVEQLRATIDGLQQSDLYKQGRELDGLREQHRSAARRAEQDQRVAGTQQQQANDATAAAEEALAEAARLSAESARLLARVHAGAERLGLDHVTPPPGDLDRQAAQTARHLLQATVDERRRAVVTVRAAVVAHGEAVRERTRAEEFREEATGDVGEATAGLGKATSEHAEALEDQVRRLQDWLAGHRELGLDRRVLDVAEDESAVQALVLDAVRAASDRLTAGRQAAETRREELRRQREALDGELRQVLADVDLPPPAPHTRGADRRSRPGAPLWRLTGFAEAVPEPVRAGVEAALEASGLLDAWLLPDGRLRGLAASTGSHDTFVVTPQPLAGHVATLADVLTVEPDPAVPAEVVAGVLRGIAYGPALPSHGEMAVAADGSWRLAALSGSWAKAEAAYVGATARERARARRVKELGSRLAGLDESLAAVDAALAELASRGRDLDEEVSSRPDHARITKAAREVDAAGVRLADAERRLTACNEKLAARTRDVAAALVKLDRIAATHRLPTADGALDDVEKALAGLQATAQGWWEACASWSAAQERAVIRQGAVHRAVEAAQAAHERAVGSARDSDGLRARLDAVESAVAAPYLEVLARLETARQELRTATSRRQSAQERVERLSGLVGRLDELRTKDTESRDTAIGERDRAAAGLRGLLGSRLAEDAGAHRDLSDGVRATLDAARGLAARWPSVPHGPAQISQALSRLADGIHQARDVLVQRADLELQPADEVQEVVASIGGLRVGAAGLLAKLRAEHDAGRNHITEAEHELFDRTLTGDTRRHLAARIRQATELVDAMNSRLELVRTASDVAVRLTWQVDPSLPAGTRAARDLLLRNPATLSDTDRDALHTFFRERVEEARARGTSGSWQEQIADVFDYTAWHQFVVKIDKGSGWEVLTKKLHGALSGGEKAIALHLPLFATVAAHCGAAATGPRLILLDEVFVGVDAMNRGQVFALLAALDLDLVLTSDHEWCTYAELDGIAVHQLLTGDDDGDDAVTSVRFTWDGRQLAPAGAEP